MEMENLSVALYIYRGVSFQMMIRVQSPDGQKRVELEHGDTSDMLLAKVHKIQSPLFPQKKKY